MGLVPFWQPSTLCFVAVIVQCGCVVLWRINLLFLSYPVVERVSVHKTLGVMVNANLKWNENEQVAAITPKAAK